MSGGGSSKKNDTPKTETPATTPMQTIQPGMPGQISTLADQLAAGFGQNPADILAQLQQYYQPMSIPNYAPGATVTPTATTSTPTTSRPGAQTPVLSLNGQSLNLPQVSGVTGRNRTWGN